MENSLIHTTNVVILGVVLFISVSTHGFPSVPTNGVESESRIIAGLNNVLPKHSQPRDMLGETVYLNLDLFHVVDVDEKGSCLICFPPYLTLL